MPRTERRLRLLWLPALILAAAVPVAAQLPARPAPPATPEAVSDPLGRDTPRGTLTGFNSAVRRNDIAVAARYLQVGRRDNVETLARDLNDLIDRYFTVPITSVSAAPQGAFNDGLAPDRERLTLSIGDRPVEIYLVRVDDANAGRIWLFSSQSLAAVPALHDTRQTTFVESLMPTALSERRWLGFSLAHWTFWAASLLLPLLAFWTVGTVLVSVVGQRITARSRRPLLQAWWKGVRWLFIVGLALVTHLLLLPFFGFSLWFRFAYARVLLVVAVLIFALLAVRLVHVSFEHARVVAIRRGRAGTGSLIVLGERVAKAIVAALTILGLMVLVGLDPSTALAGLGIVGVALALGAQKTVENLLGGIFLLADKALAVGDYCRLSDREGWVEDVTLRSVRLRTVQHTLLSVPAGLLAQGSIENFTSRGKFLVQSVLRLRYGTTEEQLRAVLRDLHRAVAEHPKIERDSARVSLIDFSAQAIELELFAYVAARDVAEFQSVRQGLLLQAAAIIEASGSAFAAPPQYVYVRQDASEPHAAIESGPRPAPPGRLAAT